MKIENPTRATRKPREDFSRFRRETPYEKIWNAFLPAREEGPLQAPKIQRNINKLKDRKEKLDQVIFGENNNLDSEFLRMYSKEIGDCQREIRELEYKLHEIEQRKYVPLSTSITSRIRDDFHKIMRMSDPALQKTLLRQLIDAIVINDHDIRIVYKLPEGTNLHFPLAKQTQYSY